MGLVGLIREPYFYVFLIVPLAREISKRRWAIHAIHWEEKNIGEGLKRNKQRRH